MISETIEGDSACSELVGVELANRLIAQGAQEMLKEIRLEISK